MKLINKGSKKKDIGAQGLSKLTKAMLLRSIIQAYVLAIKMASQEFFLGQVFITCRYSS